MTGWRGWTMVMAGLTACAGAGDTDTEAPGNPLDDIDAVCIEVDPVWITFEDRVVGKDTASETRTVTVSSTCPGTLVLSAVELAPRANPDVFAVGAPGSVALGPDEQTTFDVTFTPHRVGPVAGRVLIDSNALENPTEVVRLEGHGLAPVAHLDASAHDFGEVGLGCTVRHPLQLTNRGNMDLTVTAVRLLSASDDELGVDLDAETNGPLPWTLAPYDNAEGAPSLTVFATFRPTDTVEDSGQIVITTDDPRMPETVVTLAGRGVDRPCAE